MSEMPEKKKLQNQEDIKLEFGEKVYQDKRISIYNARNLNDDSPLVVLVADYILLSDFNPDINKKIKKTCDTINVASMEAPSLCPVIDHGITGKFKPFFVSRVPEGEPVDPALIKTAENVLSITKEVTDTTQVLDSLKLYQEEFLLSFELYKTERGDLRLLFPGIRGLLSEVKNIIEDKKNAECVHNKNVTQVAQLFENLTIQTLRNNTDDSALLLLNEKCKHLEEEISDPDYDLNSFQKFIFELEKEILSYQIEQLDNRSLHPRKESSEFDSNLQDDDGSLDKGKEEDFLQQYTKSVSKQSRDYVKPVPEVFSSSKVQDRKKQKAVPNEPMVSEKFTEVANNVYNSSSNSGKSGLSISSKSKILSKVTGLILIGVIIVGTGVFIKNTFLNKNKSIAYNTGSESDINGASDSKTSFILEDEVEPVEGESGQDEMVSNENEVLESEKSETDLDNNKLESKGSIDKKDLETDVKSEEPTSWSDLSFTERKDIINNMDRPLSSENMEIVIKSLNAEEFDLRIAAVRALGEKAVKNDRETKKLIESMFEDKDVLVRGFAAFSLVSYSGEEALPFLKIKLNNEESEIVRSAIKRAIGKIE